MINMTEYQTKMLEKQDMIISLLRKLIVVSAAGAVSEPHTAVNIYDRQSAANFAQEIFADGRWDASRTK